LPKCIGQPTGMVGWGARIHPSLPHLYVSTHSNDPTLQKHNGRQATRPCLSGTCTQLCCDQKVNRGRRITLSGSISGPGSGAHHKAARRQHGWDCESCCRHRWRCSQRQQCRCCTEPGDAKGHDRLTAIPVGQVATEQLCAQVSPQERRLDETLQKRASAKCTMDGKLRHKARGRAAP